MYRSRRFPGHADQLPDVEGFVRAVVEPGDADTAAAIAVALADNAIRHTDSGLPGGTFEVQIAVLDDTVQIRVDDAGSDSEPYRAPGDDGHGLARIVALGATLKGLGGPSARAMLATIPRTVPTGTIRRQTIDARGTR